MFLGAAVSEREILLLGRHAVEPRRASRRPGRLNFVWPRTRLLCRRGLLEGALALVVNEAERQEVQIVPTNVLRAGLLVLAEPLRHRANSREKGALNAPPSLVPWM